MYGGRRSGNERILPAQRTVDLLDRLGEKLPDSLDPARVRGNFSFGSPRVGLSGKPGPDSFLVTKPVSGIKVHSNLKLTTESGVKHFLEVVAKREIALLNPLRERELALIPGSALGLQVSNFVAGQHSGFRPVEADQLVLVSKEKGVLVSREGVNWESFPSDL